MSRFATDRICELALTAFRATCCRFANDDARIATSTHQRSILLKEQAHG
jgi:hypothetical protein